MLECYKTYDASATDDTFYDLYPKRDAVIKCVKQLYREKEIIEKSKLDLTPWDEFLGYGQVKRNIAYLNLQLKEGVHYYTDERLVLVGCRQRTNVLSDTIVKTGSGRKWQLQDSFLTVSPHQDFYYDEGYEVRRVKLSIEMFFLPEIVRIGIRKGMLEFKERLIGMDFQDIININNIFENGDSANNYRVNLG